MSDAHHEFCPKCGRNEAEKVLDGVRCYHCGQLTRNAVVSVPPPAVVCPYCEGINVGLENPHHCVDYPVGHCKLFRCLSCEEEFAIKLSDAEKSNVPPAPPSTVMLSSGVVLSVDEARRALEEVREAVLVCEGDGGCRAYQWLSKYFPKSMDL